MEIFSYHIYTSITDRFIPFIHFIYLYRPMQYFPLYEYYKALYNLDHMLSI